MANKFTGKNRQAAKFLGQSEDLFRDPGFCLGCGEEECECDVSEEDRCKKCFEPNWKCTCADED
jgi:hypothetical protein